MRPLSVGEILDASFSAVRRNFGGLMLCVLVVVVPIAILEVLLQVSATDNYYEFSTRDPFNPDQSLSNSEILAQSIGSLLTALSATLGSAACMRMIGGAVLGEKVTARESLGFAVRRFLPLLGITILYVIAVVAGVLLCLVGAVWTSVLFSLAVPALLFENARGTRAMGRSRALITDHWWRSFAVLVVMYILLLVVSFVLGLLVGAVLVASSDNSDVLAAVVDIVIAIVAYGLSTPLLAAAQAYLYFDLRVRKEGLDIQLLAQRIGTDDAAPAVAGLPPLETAPAPTTSGGFLPPQAPPPPPPPPPPE
jgi:hypothetical protein